MASPADTPGAAELVIALADDELCVGQNHSWWIAVGPFLEEDLAFISIAQDELAHARSLYELVGPASADTASADTASTDAAAYLRTAEQYRCAHLTELPCHDWAEALVRHYLYDAAEEVRWGALADSSWTELGSLARRVLIEERIHSRHAASMVARLLGTEEGSQRLGAALVKMAALARGLFDAAAPASADPAGEQLVAAAVMSAGFDRQAAQWAEIICAQLAPFSSSFDFKAFEVALDEAQSQRPTQIDPGRLGQRSEHFAALHHEMIEVFELDPVASW